MKNNIINNITNNFYKMQKLFLYRIAIMIFGIFTYLFIWVKKYILYKYHKKLYRNNYIYSEAEIEKLAEEYSLHIEKEKEILSKSISKEEKENRIKKYIDNIKKSTNKYINKEIKSNIEDSAILKNLLENNIFFIYSVIFSLPMYILIYIFSHWYMKYIFERIVMMLFVMFGVIFLVFTILYISPMDSAVNILGQDATKEQIEAFNKSYGLDKSYIEQLFSSLKNIITFNLGKSYVGNEDIFSAIARKFPITLSISFLSLLLAIIIAIPAGVISSIKQYSIFDYVFMLVALIGLSIPNFWIGLILILNFSINLNIFPASFSVHNISSYIMPTIVLGTGLSAAVARMTRASMLEIKSSEFVLTARSKGLNENIVIFRHIFKNALIPIITVIGIQLGSILGGAAVTEKVFNINGIGSYIVDKQFIPDIPVILAGVVYISIVVSIVNLMMDILYAFLDPRIKSDMKNY
ncbi:ABC transporter permease [Brachyspira aalborgi]|uniref:ABC transporter permease n=2 Tax=Brachyspira aalborgi TaxID=29522 RepID=A0A5C8EJH0_9SPIR|nr:ABC transporter permease [Brachyspira aalborgi]TXJ36260.1 ABC transporter permease [Brachyspira aalborgi]